MKSKVIIAGGGPAGLTAAIYCARAGLNPIVANGDVLGNLMPGGQLMTTTEVENYPGFPEGITGPELVERMQKQAERFGTKFINDWASNCKLCDGGFTINIGDTEYTTPTLIIATGATAKWLNLENEDRYKNNGISACATCDGALPCFRNKHLYVVGGGDTAMEEALHLTKFASKVTIVHRRDTLRASKVMQQRAFDNPKIDFLWSSEIVEYEGYPYLEALQIRNNIDGAISRYETPGLFMGIGHTPVTEFLGDIVDLDPQGYIKTRENIYTSVPGLFTCGDVHDIHYKQAITAAGFGCMAAIAADRYLSS